MINYYTRDVSNNFSLGSEDCLYLNVFVNPKNTQNGGPKQTLVWFHGGAFIFGGIDYFRGRCRTINEAD